MVLGSKRTNPLFVAFDPRTFAENRQVPAVAITDFLLFNKEVPVGETDSPLKSSITFSDKVVLTADQNSFSFLYLLSFYKQIANQSQIKSKKRVKITDEACTRSPIQFQYILYLSQP